MTWFKVDDGFWSHPKTATLSDAAVTLWVRGGSYSCQHLTDGFVKQAALRLLGGMDAAQELVDVGLWHPVEDGWEFHDWDEYQETSEVVKKRRDDARERQRRSRELREEKRAQSQGESRVTDSVTDTVTTSVSSQPPTRPDPTRPDLSVSPNGDTDSVVQQVAAPESETAPTAPRNGSRLSPDWMPSQSAIDAMKAECPHVDLQAEHRKFVDHWTDKTGKDATKRTWDGTWRNWIRRAAENPRASLKVVNGTGSTVDDKVNGWLDLASSTGRELE